MRKKIRITFKTGNHNETEEIEIKVRDKTFVKTLQYNKSFVHKNKKKLIPRKQKNKRIIEE